MDWLDAILSWSFKGVSVGGTVFGFLLTTLMFFVWAKGTAAWRWTVGGLSKRSSRKNIDRMINRYHDELALTEKPYLAVADTGLWLIKAVTLNIVFLLMFLVVQFGNLLRLRDLPTTPVEFWLNLAVTTFFVIMATVTSTGMMRDRRAEVASFGTAQHYEKLVESVKKAQKKAAYSDDEIAAKLATARRPAGVPAL